MSYRVELPVFSGPMDLLLHLVKQQEVDVHAVRIADILDQYLQHLKVLEALDLGDLGDFLVMASTLMEIKSREILPTESVEISDELDPKDDLIRRLLEYKRYRDISRRLDRLAKRRTRMLDAAIAPPKEAAAGGQQELLLDLGDVEVWNLTAAFARLLEETGLREQAMTVGVDRRGARHWAGHVLDRVRSKSEVRFEELFDPEEGRLGMIGVFCAILELMKQGVLRAHHQQQQDEEIIVAYVGDPTLSVDAILAGGERLDAGDDQGDGDQEGPDESSSAESSSAEFDALEPSPQPAADPER